VQDQDGLLERARQIGNRIQVAAKTNQNILILCNHDADGLASATLVSNFVARNRGHCGVRAFIEPNLLDLENLAKSNYDLIIFLDLGASLGPRIAEALGDRWVLVAHDESFQDEEYSKPLSESILNSSDFGFDGASEVCSSALCYFVTEKTRDSRSAFLAMVGALGDGQDVGPKRSLLGLNAGILEIDGQSSKEITSLVDLLLYGREVLPIHEALANNSSVFIHGLTGNKDSCLASLRSAGLELKFSGRWKTEADFVEDEKRSLLEAIVPHLAGTMLTAGDLVGTVYLLSSEDEYSIMRDARDLSLLLNAGGRMNKAGLILSFSLGWSASHRAEAEQILAEYRTDLVRSVQTLMSNAERVLDRQNYTIFVGDGIVRERMSGSVCEVLANLNRSRGKAVIVRTTTSQGEVEVSARLGRESEQFDLGAKMHELARVTSGIGGGVSNRANARFSMSKLQEFQTAVDGLFKAQRSN
jgi:single-stranded-DNA-specific exonuclease